MRRAPVPLIENRGHLAGVGACHGKLVLAKSDGGVENYATGAHTETGPLVAASQVGSEMWVITGSQCLKYKMSDLSKEEGDKDAISLSDGVLYCAEHIVVDGERIPMSSSPQTGCRCRGQLLISLNDAYTLFNLTTRRQIPLFSLGPNLPFKACAVPPHEFLIVQGTSVDESAMGLVIDAHSGEISREGVLSWDAYPSSIAVMDDIVVAVVNGNVITHTLSGTHSTTHGRGEAVFKLSSPVEVPSDAIAERLGEDLGIELSDTVIYCKHGFDALIGHSELLLKEKQIEDGELTELAPVTMTSEREVAEFEYLSLLLALVWLPRSRRRSLSLWLEGVRLDPRILLYIAGHTDEKPNIYPGLMSRLSSTRKPSAEFMRSYLSIILKRYRNSSDALRKELEMAYASYLDGEELVRFYLNRRTVFKSDLKRWLTDSGRYEQLIEILRMSNDHSALAQAYYNVASGQWALETLSPSEALQRLTKELISSSDKDLVWSLGLATVQLDPEVGLRVFIDPDRYIKWDSGEVLEALKIFPVAWREYIHHCIEENPEGVELAPVVVANLVEIASTEAEPAYAAYRSLSYPKKPFLRWSQRPPLLASMEHELWTLLVRKNADATPLISIIDEQAPELLSERALLYSSLGLHSQALKALVDATDYASVLWYCHHGYPPEPTVRDVDTSEDGMRRVSDATTTCDLAKLALPLIVNTPALTEFLDQTDLDLHYFLDHVPPSIEAGKTLNFLTDRIAGQVSRTQEAKMQSALVRAIAREIDADMRLSLSLDKRNI